jgi:hypothetical protein
VRYDLVATLEHPLTGGSRTGTTTWMARNRTYRPSVFISYAARGTDQETAQVLRDSLEANKVRVPAWRDKEDLRPGTRAIHAIQRGIAECDFFLLLVSPRSVLRSRWCPREWRRADRLGKVIIPLVLEPVPDDAWPLELEEQQWLDFQRGVEHGLPDLLAAIGVATSRARPGRDPLDRDDDRMRALAGVFYYFASNPLMGLRNVQAVVRNLRVCVETDRAAQIVDEVCRRTFPDCRQAGDVLLQVWDAPTTRGRTSG